MKVGDVIESAIWVTGDESQAMRKQYEQDVSQAIADLCTEEGFEHGPVAFIEKRPEEAGHPVPDHVQGSRVRLLVAEAEVLSVSVLSSEGSFVANLDKKDLDRLRTITRRAAKKVLTDAECDECIEQYGPETAIELIRAQYHTLQ